MISHLLEVMERERADEVLMAGSVAAVRLGLPVAEGWSLVHRHASRRVMTWYGPKELGEAVGFGRVEAARRWRLALAPHSEEDPDQLSVEPSRALRGGFKDRIQADSRDVEAWEALGAQQNSEDHDLLVGRTARKAAVESHARIHALGLHGDPRAARFLTRRLRGLGDDPGHGFQSRRAVGLALGRLGDPRAGRVLCRALEDEALEHEGRPGAGLGIQIPVRATLLYALGEAGSRTHIELLCRYLANTSGSVLGGFYLPAMDALIKLGAASEVRTWAEGPELVAANALGVLGALGDMKIVRSYIDDPRPRVAEAARMSIEIQSER